MQLFRITRSAVIPLLIVALAIQPVALCLADRGAQAACLKVTSSVNANSAESSSADPSSATCQGCGRCNVERPAERCCCCNSEPESAAKEEVGTSCCSEEHAPAESRSSSPERQSASTPASVDAAVRSIFLCGQRSQPLSDSSPRCPTSENRDHAACDSTVIDESQWDADGLMPIGPTELATAVSSDFAQVMLCIWRL